MDKPKPKREVAIYFAAESARHISFEASQDAIRDFEDFGQIKQINGLRGYNLFVDSRYDFDEVVAYIENYG